MKLESGKKLNFNKVVVTVNLGVLQNNLIKFEPPLPKWKRDAFNELKIV